eukprot:CAMPEP_0115709918 /NCGR_PEP_ID=MMETSP0272-20121206/72738_1 /TAXON_ID=71861 /ORGANISM="Scrippsiella trochoidea, Strain CCMP3099" /LENGTH=135 /DNA_ID=CAMNT_0003151581 /DNA_START=471 /DNA_END=876 /DNA_ORIENTATION=+
MLGHVVDNSHVWTMQPSILAQATCVLRASTCSKLLSGSSLVQGAASEVSVSEFILSLLAKQQTNTTIPAIVRMNAAANPKPAAANSGSESPLRDAGTILDVVGLPPESGTGEVPEPESAEVLFEWAPKTETCIPW